MSSSYYFSAAEGTEDENESDLDLMPEDDQIIFHQSEPRVVYGNSGDSADEVHHLETGVGELMSNGGELYFAAGLVLF